MITLLVLVVVPVITVMITRLVLVVVPVIVLVVINLMVKNIVSSCNDGTT